MLKYQKLRKLYKNFVRFEKKEFVKDIEKQLGVKELSLSPEIYKKVYENFYKPTFVQFVNRLKAFKFKDFENFLKMGNDIWDFLHFLRFLENESIIKIERKNRLKILDSTLFEGIVPPISEEEIIKILEKKLGISLAKCSNFPVFSIFSKFGKTFRWKECYDQLPISTSSAIFLLEKILEYLPLEDEMLIVGDDDFISLLLGLIYPKIKITVVDIDERILEIIEKISKKFDLNITSKKIDVRKGKIKKKFVGFLTNPPYTEEGVKTFIKFGVGGFGKEGGICFLVLGEESIGNRFLFLQNFFAKLNLRLEELIKGCIFYPYTKHKEFDIVMEKLNQYMNVKNIILIADLYVFNFIPWKIKSLKYPREIYSYL